MRRRRRCLASALAPIYGLLCSNSPTGDCQHSGTYNGHPVAVAAAIAAVTAYREPGFYDHVHAVARELYEGLNDVFRRHIIDAHVQGLGARFGVYFGLPGRAASYRDAVRFPNGREVRLQELREGQRVTVLDLSVAEELDLERLREERAEFTYRTR